MTVVRDTATSMYQQIADVLREEILRGAYLPSGKLPSEAQLGERFGVSRVTVRLAIDALDAQNMVERKQGKGTFASPRRLRHRLDVMEGFHDAMIRQGVEATMRLLGIDSNATAPSDLEEAIPFADRLGVSLTRLHVVGDVPIALAETWLLSAAAKAVEAMAESTPSYRLIEAVPGWQLAAAETRVTAVAADTRLSGLLAVPIGSPLLVMKRVSTLVDGRLCEGTVFHIRPEEYELIVSSTARAALAQTKLPGTA